jgi:hypothetical protein
LKAQRMAATRTEILVLEKGLQSRKCN